jgi:hypothetical protein
MSGLMDAYEYVERKWGSGVVAKLKSIRRGGNNSAKGTDYENQYAVYRICLLAAFEESAAAVRISAQEVAFVDDLCIRHDNVGRKINFQLKNSSGVAADFTSDLAERFRRQLLLDLEHHGFRESEQVLLVSCEVKAAENASAIPDDLAAVARSEYFPYCARSLDLMQSIPRFRLALERLCQSSDLSVLDTAYRVLLGAWISESRMRSVAEIMECARGMVRPNLFPLGLVQVPDWLQSLCASLAGVSVFGNAGRYVVTCSGLEVSVDPEDLLGCESEFVGVHTPVQLIEAVARCAAMGFSRKAEARNG